MYPKNLNVSNFWLDLVRKSTGIFVDQMEQIQCMNLIQQPDFILEKIFSQLSIKDIVHVIPLVCKRFHQIIKGSSPFWRLIHQRILTSIRSREIYMSYNALDHYQFLHEDPIDPKRILSHLQCLVCHKIYTDESQIHRCRCSFQTCEKCHSQLVGYSNKCYKCVIEHNWLTPCSVCHKFVSKQKPTTSTTCCQQWICEDCQTSPRIITVDATVWCRQHLPRCQGCGHWCLDTLDSTCCQKKLCSMCQTYCHGCFKIHCPEHCQQHRCQMDCCRMGDCMMSGSLCHQCEQPIEITLRRCHPSLNVRQKLCVPCFDQKQMICQFCHEIVSINQCQTCDKCQITGCSKHLYQSADGSHTWCTTCYHSMVVQCDLCQNLFSIDSIHSTPYINICAECTDTYVS